MSCDEVKPLLNARVDGEIHAAERIALDKHVRGCASCSAELAGLEGVRDAIRAERPYYSAPAGLRERVQFAVRGAQYLERSPARIAWKLWLPIAAGLIIAALGTAPFIVSQRNQRQLVAQDLISAHQRALIGRELDIVSSDQHNVKPWFNGKLPFSPPVLDLASDGFPLNGGRVDYADGRPVAVLVYGRRLHHIDVFVWPSANAKAPPNSFQENGFNEVSWARNGFQFAAVSDLNSGELGQFAGLMQTR